MIDSKLELTLNRNLLKYAIMHHRTFFCARSGRGLDIRRSVLCTVSGPGLSTFSEVVDGSVWDAHGDSTIEGCNEVGATVEVWDGRRLSSRSATQQALG